MLALTATTETLELSTSSTASTDFHVTFVDHTTSGGTPGTQSGNITTATTTTILAAPASSTYRQVRQLSVKNKGTAVQAVVLKKDISGTERELTASISLGGQESLWMDGNGLITIFDSAGRPKFQAAEISGYSGRSTAYYKVGTAAEAVGVNHSLHAATGFPGAWAPGTPGLAGRATDGTAVADAGCLLIANPSTGANYLIQNVVGSSVAHLHWIRDYLWVNSGTVVTTTTAQTVNSVAFPARDINGSTNGEGVNVAILVTTATTNAGAITNTTMSYTNSDGTAGRTATMASFPATAVAGTFVMFQLAAGDKGVRSIQSVTLGTTYGGGAISLVAFTNLTLVPNTVVNVGGQQFPIPANPGIRLYNSTCAIPGYLASATTATNVTGMIAVMER